MLGKHCVCSKYADIKNYVGVCCFNRKGHLFGHVKTLIAYVSAEHTQGIR